MSSQGGTLSRLTFNALFDRAAVAAFVIIGGFAGSTLWTINERTAKLQAQTDFIQSVLQETRSKVLLIDALNVRITVLENTCKRK